MLRIADVVVALSGISVAVLADERSVDVITGLVEPVWVEVSGESGIFVVPRVAVLPVDAVVVWLS